jgi:Ca-activated chloride channel family protein
VTPEASLSLFRFANWELLSVALLGLLVLLWIPRRGGASFSGFALAQEALRPSLGPAIHRLLIATGIVALAVALARPQFGREIIEREQSGRDLQLVIDLSGSMQVDDLVDEQNQRIDRLAAVMQAAKRFVANRPNDRIGLVFFGDRALTSCPLTYDHETVTQFIERTERQQRALWNAGHEKGLLGNATNLGLGLGTALRGLKDPQSKGRAIILITDGADSRELPSWVDPVEAARHARATGVTVYGIGVGNPNGTRSERDPFTGRMRTARLPGYLQPDMARLEVIVAQADGKAFRANDRVGLDQVFSRIDELEPTPRTVRMRQDFADRNDWLLVLGTLLVALALLLEPRLRGVA